ncbi:hypothetical protein H5410_057688 [Solanum commersonii]|uniref:Uncharacterized protein n=1 Tax=Solanum commersonii TaxID=4109 RepID=A0A9J5WPP2_SOLCO|nr:hypothetical protein H5410_057688 [Solanum commersonii]
MARQDQFGIPDGEEFNRMKEENDNLLFVTKPERLSIMEGSSISNHEVWGLRQGKEPQYFKSAFLGYTFGLALTIFVMNWFQAAQLLEFDEGKTKDAEEADAKESKKIIASGSKSFNLYIVDFSMKKEDYILVVTS